MPEQFLSVRELDDNLSHYWRRRVQLKLKDSSPLTKLGDVLTCITGYYDEHAIDIDDEEEKKFMGYGLHVRDVKIDEKSSCEFCCWIKVSSSVPRCSRASCLLRSSSLPAKFFVLQ